MTSNTDVDGSAHDVEKYGDPEAERKEADHQAEVVEMYTGPARELTGNSPGH